jgi:hypothetical protein
MYRLILVTLLAILAGCGQAAKEKPQMDQVIWNIDSTTSIGGHPARVLGSPKVLTTPTGKALEFDGRKDAILVDTNPVEGWKNFTIEIVFRPDADGLPEQRFLHIQEAGTRNRIMFETRLPKEGGWYADSFLQSGAKGTALIDPNNEHPTGAWFNFTTTYDGEMMAYYINGAQEMTAKVPFVPLGKGTTSIGVRQNLVCWFKGAVRMVRFTPGILKPEEMLKP